MLFLSSQFANFSQPHFILPLISLRGPNFPTFVFRFFVFVFRAPIFKGWALRIIGRCAGALGRCLWFLETGGRQRWMRMIEPSLQLCFGLVFRTKVACLLRSLIFRAPAKFGSPIILLPLVFSELEILIFHFLKIFEFLTIHYFCQRFISKISFSKKVLFRIFRWNLWATFLKFDFQLKNTQSGP